MSAIAHRLGNQSDVTDQNIMDYLSGIEEMANDLVKRHIVTADSDDSLARATSHRQQSDELNGAPAADDQPTQAQTDQVMLEKLENFKKFECSIYTLQSKVELFSRSKNYALQPQVNDEILDLMSIRSQAAANVQAREKERVMAGHPDGKQPQIIAKDNKRNKAKK